nr:ribonuclease H-like domain-containing protein [Tanacetum cinerariifolium]
MNATLEAEVLTRSSNSSRTSYAIAADLSEMELNKILIEKMEGNKFIQRSDEQRNLYKALVEAYDADKTILDTYGELTILKRRREDDDQEGPSAGSDRGSKRQREGGEHASASTSSETATGSAGRSTTGSQSRQLSTSESAFAEEPVQTTFQMEEPSHLMFETGAEDQPSVQTSQHPEWFSQPRGPPSPDRDWNKTLPAAQGDAQSWISILARQTDARSSFNKLLDTPIDFSNFIMNWLGSSVSPFSSSGFTFEHIKKLLSLMNDSGYVDNHANMNLTVSIVKMFIVVDISSLKITVGHPNGTLATISHVGNLKLTNNVVLYNVLVVLGYFVSLPFVNKLIRDSKMFVGFDEEKLLWHNILGYPADQNLSTLHKDLNISKTSYVPIREVCHKAKQTREPFPLSDHKSKKLGCKRIFKIKYKASGEIERYKARLVAKGFSQRESFDYDETFSSVIKMVTASDLVEDVYMTFTQGYDSDDKSKMCRLNKSLYGLKQASRQLNAKLTTTLIE